MNSLLDKLRGLVKPRAQSVVGIDISSSAIKMVQLTKRNNKAILETYGEIALGPYGNSQIGRSVNLSTEKTGEALQDLIREAKITSASVGVSIPTSASLIRIIEMPNLPEEKLKEMIPLEVRKFIPVPVSEVLLDWWVIPQTREEREAGADAPQAQKIEVLVVAIHNEIISRYKQIIEQTGLAASFYEIELFSTMRAVLDRNRQPSMIVDIGAATTKVYIVENGIVRGSHIVNSGSQNITLTLSSSYGVSVEEAEEMKREKGLKQTMPDPNFPDSRDESLSLILDSLLVEARRVMSSFQGKYGREVSKVIFTGGGTIIHGLLERAQKMLETEVVIADPFSRVESPAFLDPVLTKAGPEFTVAIGLALRKLDELS